MRYAFSDLIDVARVQRLTDLFYTATGIPSAVIDLDGAIITGSGWQEICTSFHRVNPGTRQRCIESDTVIANQVAAGQKYTVYKCKNGLIDAATPIAIEGEHVANFFTGQFLFGPPKLEFFQEQARRCGFDEAAYMRAVAQIPVLEEAKLGPFLEYLSEFAAMLGEMGLRQLRQIEATAARRRYEMIAGNTRDIILFLNRDDGRVLEANVAATNAYGYGREELLSLTIYDLRIPEDRGEIAQQIAEADRVGILFETTHRRKDGTTFPVEVSSRGETVDGVRTVISVIRDITARKKAETALRQSEQRWATTLASIGDAVIATDDDGKITFMNSVAEKLTGWGLPEAVMKPTAEVFNIINEHTRKAVDNPVTRVLREGVVVGLANHTLLIRKDGTELPIDDSGAPIRDKDGRSTGVVLVFRNITERKRAEEALLRAKEEWERTFASVPDSISIIDDQHRILQVNEAMAQRLGRKTEECIGLHCYEAVHGLSEPPDFCPHSRTLRDGCQHIEEVHEERLGGDFLVSTTPLHNERGQMIGTVHVAHDITERKKAEEALRKAMDELELKVQERTTELRQAYDSLMAETKEREQLQVQLRQAQKMEALGTLSGGIAHDFNNILAAIIGFTELVAGRVAKGSRDERHLARVMEASLRGRELVKQMLTFSRKVEQEKRPLRLNSIVKETAKLLRASIPTTISIRVNVGSEPGVILGDPTQVQQVLMNLCTNAAQAMQEKGGVLDVELSDVSVSPLSANHYGVEPGLYVKLAVRDTGAGISPDIIDKIFDPFFTTKRLGEGTGLGLSVVHGIIRQSNGYITVDSEPGKGSAFSAYFPKISEKPTADVVSDEALPAGDERILLVDDEEALVETGEDILAELGYEVTSRTSSREALALFRLDPSRFDLVITDQTMPELTGVEMAREMLAIRPDLPVILATGFSNLVDADSAKATGIRAFAMKPLTKREIAKTVRMALDQHQ